MTIRNLKHPQPDYRQSSRKFLTSTTCRPGRKPFVLELLTVGAMHGRYTDNVISIRCLGKRSCAESTSRYLLLGTQGYSLLMLSWLTPTNHVSSYSLGIQECDGMAQVINYYQHLFVHTHRREYTGAVL